MGRREEDAERKKKEWEKEKERNKMKGKSREGVGGREHKRKGRQTDKVGWSCPLLGFLTI